MRECVAGLTKQIEGIVETQFQCQSEGNCGAFLWPVVVIAPDLGKEHPGEAFIRLEHNVLQIAGYQTFL